MTFAERLDIENRCVRTINRYAIAVGEGDPETFTKLFTEDATWQRPGQEPLVGHAAIHDFISAGLSGARVVHLNGSYRIDVESDKVARGISYTTVYDSAGSTGDIPDMVGPDYVVEYRDIYHESDGEWLIHRRDTSLLFRYANAADLPGIPNPNRK